MRVLITGASGNLGAYIIRELMDQHELVLFARKQPADEFSRFPWVQGDLNSFADCQRALVGGIEAIQHIGAQPWPTDHPNLRAQANTQGIPFDVTFKSNMLGVYNLMQAAMEAEVKTVIMAGSNCALGHGFRISGTPFPLENLPIDEEHPCYPEDSYSFTKRTGEDLLHSYTRAYGIRTYVTRIAGICPLARRQEMAQNATEVTGWSDWLWCWVGSEDVARAHRLLMEASMDSSTDLPPHDVYYLNADDTSLLEPSRDVIAEFRPVLVPLAENLDGHQSFFSNEKLKRAVGWQHTTSWRRP